jgi:hypothetical protein
MTASLGRCIEKYDQLCDTIESHIVSTLRFYPWVQALMPICQLRAISILKRDAELEEQRLKDAQTAAVATRTRSKSMSVSPTSTRVPLPPVAGSDAPLELTTDQSTVQALSRSQTSLLLTSASLPLGRRPSAISLSSLHRPPFPHKLDLSSVALRITPEEASMYNSGLASPVTLAPKSARLSASSEYPPELIVAFASADAASQSVDIDLGLSNIELPSGRVANHTNNQMGLSLDPNVGSSPEKPIELDLGVMDIDMTELFGDPAEPGANDTNVDGLFTPSTAAPDMTIPTISVDDKINKPQLGIDMLDPFSHGSDDIFASFGAHSPSNPQNDGQDGKPSQLLSIPSQPGDGISGRSMADAAPSPGSLLASLTSNQHGDTNQSTSSNVLTDLPGADATFDLATIDFSQLGPAYFTSSQSNDTGMVDMDAFLGITGRDQQQTSTESSRMEH